MQSTKNQWPCEGGRPGDLLRFITCGSVDDGKSTLIGRLLHDSKLIYDDQLSSLFRDSERHGTTGDDIDFALLVDGLEAEREQGNRHIDEENRAPRQCIHKPAPEDRS